MSSQATNSTTAAKPVAVVAPCQRLTDDSMRPVTEDSGGPTSRCDGETSTERQARAASGREKVSDGGRLCSESAGDSWLNEVDVDRRAASTCAVRPSRRVVVPPNDDDDDESDLTSCPYYHGNIASDEAKRRLADKSVGTYLLRDSQSPCFPFSLSVRTTSGRSGGVTSLRIARDGNKFRLDCDEAHRALMPKFDSVQRLVRHFTAETDGGQGGRCLLVHGASAAASSQSNEQPLTLRQPLHRPAAAVNQH